MMFVKNVWVALVIAGAVIRLNMVIFFFLLLNIKYFLSVEFSLWQMRNLPYLSLI